jgi:hypothetical protein
MSRTFHHGERRIRVHGVRKDPPDLRRLARALIELAQLQAAEIESHAEASHKQRTKKATSPPHSQNAESAETESGDAA